MDHTCNPNIQEAEVGWQPGAKCELVSNWNKDSLLTVIHGKNRTTAVSF